jgi:hypothetical protein
MKQEKEKKRTGNGAGPHGREVISFKKVNSLIG